MRSMFGRRALKTVARLALAGFLLAQVALAIAGCELGERSAAQAILNASAASDEPCHQQSEDSAALCVVHCVTQTQTLEKPFWKAPAPAAAPALVFFVVFSSPAAAAPPAVDLPLALAGPPRRILFRTLVI
jgi:hypothetical protein